MTLLIKKIVVKLYTMRSVSIKLCAAMQFWFILESLFCLNEFLNESEICWQFPLHSAKIEPDLLF